MGRSTKRSRSGVIVTVADWIAGRRRPAQWRTSICCPAHSSPGSDRHHIATEAVLGSGLHDGFIRLVAGYRFEINRPSADAPGDRTDRGPARFAVSGSSRGGPSATARKELRRGGAPAGNSARRAVMCRRRWRGPPLSSNSRCQALVSRPRSLSGGRVSAIRTFGRSSALAARPEPAATACSISSSRRFLPASIATRWSACCVYVARSCPFQA